MRSNISGSFATTIDVLLMVIWFVYIEFSILISPTNRRSWYCQLAVTSILPISSSSQDLGPVGTGDWGLGLGLDNYLVTLNRLIGNKNSNHFNFLFVHKLALEIKHLQFYLCKYSLVEVNLAIFAWSFRNNVNILLFKETLDKWCQTVEPFIRFSILWQAQWSSLSWFWSFWP